jgi:hypothetical protein
VKTLLKADAEEMLDLTLMLIRGMAANSLWQHAPMRNQMLLDRWYEILTTVWQGKNGMSRPAGVASTLPEEGTGGLSSVALHRTVRADLTEDR